MGQAWARLVLASLLLVPVVAASPAALDTRVVALPPSVDPSTGGVGMRGGYAPVVVVADVSGTLTFTNLDIAAHDIIAKQLGPTDNPWCSRYVGHHFCPLFASPLIGLGKEAVVEGTDQLQPGRTYDFFCSIHHWMTGTIVAI
ncbi:MAG TPA: hypothetical protein VFH78_04310 [Candidatus Thermoplasmatota archaeon]|nr:hypothetical protein [Candidatus Thermoplasmatota archaeon]